ncbi:MAG: polymerase, sigma-24 subunit, subfamily [Rhizobacter sp.]|nr:polymerase, sigma-24 subunit, subfamily [Rhizobacter sp.]
MNTDFLLHLARADNARLIEFARGLLGSRHDAEDAVQDAYLRVIDGAAVSVDVPQAWLTTVVRHIAIDRLRRQRLEAEWRQGEAAEVCARSAPSAEEVASLEMQRSAALRLLADSVSPLEAAIVLLREVFEIDYETLARKAGKSEAACRQLLHRALQRLRTPRDPKGRGDDSGCSSSCPLDDGETADTVFVLCTRAIDGRSPAPLYAMIAPPTVLSSSGGASLLGPRRPAMVA